MVDFFGILTTSPSCSGGTLLFGLWSVLRKVNLVNRLHDARQHVEGMLRDALEMPVSQRISRTHFHILHFLKKRV